MSEGSLLESCICRLKLRSRRSTYKRFRMILLHKTKNNRLGIILLRKNRGGRVGSATYQGVPNYFRMRSYKSLDLKSPGMCTYEMRVGGRSPINSTLLRSARADELLLRSAANGESLRAFAISRALQPRAHPAGTDSLGPASHGAAATRFHCLAKEPGARMPRHRRDERSGPLQGKNLEALTFEESLK